MSAAAPFASIERDLEVDTTKVMRLAMAEATREHLLSNWAFADEWISKVRSSNGAPCFMLRAEGKSSYEVQIGHIAYRSLIYRGGRMGALKYLNEVVVGLGGRPAAIPGARTMTVAEGAKIAALNVLALLGVVR